MFSGDERRSIPIVRDVLNINKPDISANILQNI